jgi:hypothetical protein
LLEFPTNMPQALEYERVDPDQESEFKEETETGHPTVGLYHENDNL